MFGQAPNLHLSGITLDLQHSGKSFCLMANLACMLGEYMEVQGRCMKILNNNITLSLPLLLPHRNPQALSAQGRLRVYAPPPPPPPPPPSAERLMEVAGICTASSSPTATPKRLALNGGCGYRGLGGQACSDGDRSRMELQGMFQWVLYSVVYALFLQFAFLPEPSPARARSPVEASSSSYFRAVTVFAICPIPAFFPYTGANRRGLSLFSVITTPRQTQSDSPGRRCMRICILLHDVCTGGDPSAGHLGRHEDQDHCQDQDCARTRKHPAVGVAAI